MEHRYFNDAMKHFLDQYNIDILWDVVLNREDQIILVAVTPPDNPIELHVVTTSLAIIGIEESPMITLNELLSYFDRKNNYAKVAGEAEYYHTIAADLLDFSTPSNVTFPISTSSGRRWIRLQTHAINSPKILHSVTITDVTKYLVTEEELFLKTHLDSLTSIFNKYTLDYHYGARYQMDNLHVLFLDLDNFKIVNDVLGHQEGDRLLVEFASILLKFEQNYNRFYRLGGDEFVGLFFETSDRVREVAEEILTRCRQLFQSYTFANTSVSIGIVQATHRNDVIRKADTLMYRAKDLGKNRILFASEDEL